jgi:hypothetical protein
MTVQKQPVTWPLLGSIQGKNAPLSLQPGSYLTLDDVWMQRKDEWRARPGHVAGPALSGSAVLAGTVSDAGMVAVLGSGQAPWYVYDPSLPSGGAWAPLVRTDFTPASSFGSVTDQNVASAHSRNGVATAQFSGGFALGGGFAYGGGFYLAAVPTFTTAGQDIMLYMVDAATNQVVTSASVVALTGGGLHPRCAFVANRLVCFVVDGASQVQPIIIRTDVATPTFSLGAVSTVGFAVPATMWMDAMYYTGSTITVAFRSAAGTINFREYNPATNAYSVSTVLAVNCANALHLLQEPDASGTRFVACSTATPDVRVIRVNAAGAIVTNEQADTQASTRISGVAYTAGTEWMIAYQVGTDVWGAQKQSGLFVGLGTTHRLARVDSGAWRQVGQDPMRVMIGVHEIDVTTGTGINQSTVYEVSYNFQHITVSHEPQARLTPLESAVPSTVVGGGDYVVPHVLPDGTGAFRTLLPRLAFAERSAVGTPSSVAYDQWVLRYPSASTITSTNIGRPLPLGAKTLIPSGNLLQYDPGLGLVAHGGMTIPPLPALGAPTAVGGARLTLLATYQYALVIVMIDEDGSRWRSPPSLIATKVLTGGQDTIPVSWFPQVLECDSRRMQMELYRTAGNGTVFRKHTVINKRVAEIRADLVFGAYAITDSTPDTVLASAEIAYFTGEVENALTPPVSHVEYWNGRVWGVDRDFRSRVCFSKRMQVGRSFEFVDEFALDLTDDKGDITGLAALDDKLVVFKKNARYFIQGDGPENSGAGQAPSVTRIDSDIGAIVGSPTVSTGDEVYFVADRGIYRMNTTGTADFVGAPVDRYLHQPQIQSAATIRSAFFAPAKNEVRFLTTAGTVLTYSREFGYWCRWTFQNGAPLPVIGITRGGTPTLFVDSGAVWSESDTTATDDGNTFNGKIRSAWVRAAGEEGRLRVYEGRVLGERTASGVGVTPNFAVFFDFNDATIENYPPAVQLPANAVFRAGARFARTRCTVFSFQLEFPNSDVTTRLEAWSAVIGIEQGPDAAKPSTRW